MRACQAAPAPNRRQRQTSSLRNLRNSTHARSAVSAHLGTRRAGPDSPRPDPRTIPMRVRWPPCWQKGTTGVPKPSRNLPNPTRKCYEFRRLRDEGMRAMSVLRFGAFVLDSARGTVLRDGVELELRAQSFAVLSHL